MRWARIVLSALIVACLVAIAAPAGADNPWARVAAPSPNPNASFLSSVDCVSSTNCTAVGHYELINSRRLRTLIIRTTDGITWTRVPSPNPSRRYNVLLGVNCSSATSCTAVGGYQDETPGVPIESTLVVRTDDGASWHEVAVANHPGGREGSLFSVSCVTADHCRAVGTVSEADRPLVMRTTNGTAWYRQVTPNIHAHSWLSAIDCVTDTNCTAVGSSIRFYVPGTDPGSSAHLSRTLVLRTTDGKTWTRTLSPNPAPRHTGSYLSGVSCTGPSACTAVGEVGSAPGLVHRAFILRTTDGVAWTRAATPPTDWAVALASVSCQSAMECTAVGLHYDDFQQPDRATILRTTNGTSWYSPAPGAEQGDWFPNGVSCATATRCIAVGYFAVGLEGARSLVLRET